MSNVSNMGGWEEEKLNYDSIMTLPNKTLITCAYNSVYQRSTSTGTIPDTHII